MLYLTCTMISSVDLAHYGVSCGYLWIVVQTKINNIQFTGILIDSVNEMWFKLLELITQAWRGHKGAYP